MKPLLLATALGLVAGLPAFAATQTGSPRVEVIFDHPEKFTDIRDYYQPTEKGQQAILDQIREFLEQEGRYNVPEGYTLTITFQDIKLAGDFEPWRGPNWTDVRIIKAIYVPRFKFTYVVADKAGKVVKQGTENLTDLNFQDRVALPTDDPLRYEKSILTDWVRGLALKRELKA